jgi:hypothetical protein
MRPAPADLAGISERCGAFRADAVAAYIDGRVAVSQHGPREMPVWGRRFDDRLEGSLEAERRPSPEMIAAIVANLETQQRVR